MNREIEYLVAIAEHHSFSVAAAELHVSQPALSRMVHALEERLGLKLFERKSHGVVLTHAGERYYKGALEVMKKVQVLEAEMERLKIAQAAALRVGIIRHPEQKFLARCVEEFHALHPGIRFYIEESDSAGAADNIREGGRAKCASQNIMGCVRICCPVAHSFINRILEGSASACYRMYFCSIEFHCCNVRLLAAYVYFAHINCTVETKLCTGSGGGKSVLAGSRFCNDSFFAHSFCKKALADCIVYFMGTSICKSLKLDIDLSSTEKAGSSRCKVKRSFSAYVIPADYIKFV